MLERIEHLGVLVGECALSGETKADGRSPGHGNAIPLSRDRWLLVYATRAYRQGYALRSIVYQLRESTPVGEVIREGLLRGYERNWDAFGDGRRFDREHGNVAVFGVPRGALINGKQPPHANLFAVRWCVLPAEAPQRNPWQEGDEPEYNRLYSAMDGEWLQLRLNDRGNDIEIVQPIRPLRPAGRDGQAVEGLAPGMLNAIPVNESCTEWAEVIRFQNRRCSVVKYRFNPKLGLYEWVRTGPAAVSGRSRIVPGWASLLHTGGEWILAANKMPLVWPVRPPDVGADLQGLDPDEVGVAWMRSRDPWRRLPPPVCPTRPSMYATPVTAYCCADGVVRLFGGDQTLATPSRGRRNPLRCWDIDPDNGFAASNPKVIFDVFRTVLPPRPRVAGERRSLPAADKAKLLTHLGGRGQYLIHPVHLPPEEIAGAGLYCQKLIYDRNYPPEWSYE